MNAAFQIICEESCTKLRLTPATDNGRSIDVSGLIDYLNFNRIEFQLPEINQVIHTFTEETIITLNDKHSHPIRESVVTEISEDGMTCIGKFTPPSDNGEKMNRAEIFNDLKHRGITYGIDEKAIDLFIAQRNYMEEFVIARGIEPVQGENAYIEYMFNTDLKARPTLLEDGSVDFFNLNIINHCNTGDLLARLHREIPGEFGYDVTGKKLKPADIRKMVLKFGRNVDISEDKTEIYAACSGHVSLVEGRVFVSDLMQVENVDPSTGNIEYEGNVQINGNVMTNFAVFAKGNVEVRGVVEGAEIVAGGNITIARGMNGMGRGKLKAGGNVVAQFIENSSVEAQGYVEAGSIMHSTVLAGTEVHVNGKKGFISGGKVSAATLIDVRILGSDMGTDTVVEIGVSPTAKRRHRELGGLIDANNKTINRAIPILEAARDKYNSGIRLSEDQKDNIRGLSKVVRDKVSEIKSYTKELEDLSQIMSDEKNACVSVHDTVYPGTKIVISDVSKIIKDSMSYCRFIKDRGDVRVIGMN